ncbi:MAG: Rad52/Rad22 family DNA repair protein [Hyphomicrobiaceae bacterium]
MDRTGGVAPARQATLDIIDVSQELPPAYLETSATHTRQAGPPRRPEGRLRHRWRRPQGPRTADLSEDQINDVQSNTEQALRSKLQRHVKTREADGASISYIGGYHAIAEANRIFGFDAWDRQTISPKCQWTDFQERQAICFYSTKVRITVRAGDTVTVREGIGTGFGRATRKEAAHEIALKAAETDATKRALATFGNPFGLALYDPEQAHVTKGRPVANLANTSTPARDTSHRRHFVLHLDQHTSRDFHDVQDYRKAFVAAIEECQTLQSTYLLWEANLHELGQVAADPAIADLATSLVNALKARARSVGLNPAADQLDLAASPRQTNSRHVAPTPATAATTTSTTTKSTTTHSTTTRPATARVHERTIQPKENRVRDKAHLAFVGTQPCLICGRRPAHAHHLKFAQQSAMSMKVSDEFTVPLCTIHHDQLHRSGDERAWWARNGFIEPLKIADRLWAQSRRLEPSGSDDEINLMAPDASQMASTCNVATAQQTSSLASKATPDAAASHRRDAPARHDDLNDGPTDR